MILGDGFKLSKGRAITILRKIPVFAGLQDSEYAHLIDLCHVGRYEAGEVLFNEGEHGHDMFILLAGRIDITTSRAGLIYTAEPGEIVGEIAVVNGVKRTATAVARETSAVFRVGRGELDLLLARAPRLSYVLMRNIAGMLAGRLVIANNRMSDPVKKS